MPEAIELVQRSQSGDQEAFAALFEQYKNLVYQAAYLTLNDTNAAEDALQEVFIRVYHSLANFDPAKGAFTTWLYRITMYYCLNQRRKHQIDTEPLDENAAGLDENLSTTEDIDREAILSALDRLSEKQRAVVVLRYYAAQSYAEIAEVLDIPLGTVKSRLDTAIKFLRQSIEKQDFSALPILEKEVRNEV